MGGGPAGLYFALLMKLHDPGHDITVFERSAAGSAHGWGVTFGGDLMVKFHENDAGSAREIDQAAFRWTNQVVDVHGGQAHYAGGDGYSIQRQRLLRILADRARSLGVRTELGREVESSSQLPDADLIVACDGVNSRLRHESGKFRPDVRLSGNKYIWLGTDKIFESFLYSFVRTDSGWIWAYAYPVDTESSTFIVECLPGTWTGLGFDVMPLRDSLILLEKLFDRHLDGHHLVGHSGDGVGARWLNFRTVTNQSWHHGKIVLAGDAAHTSHYSIGWGTKLAIEDVIALADSLRCHASLPTALESYERQRQAALVRPASDARFSAQWFENIGRYIDLKPEQFAMLLHGRRSPLLAHIPPKIYCQLLSATEEITVLQQLRKRVAPWAKAVYGRRMLTQSDKS